MIEQCIAGAVAWEGFVGGMAFGAIIALAFVAKKAKDKLEKTYTIDDPRRGIKVKK